MSDPYLAGTSMQHLYKCCGGYHTGVINKKENFVLFCGTVKVRKVCNYSFFKMNLNFCLLLFLLLAHVVYNVGEI